MTTSWMTKRIVLLSVLFLAGVAFIGAQEGESSEHKGGEGAEKSEPAAVWKWANFAILAAGLGYFLVKALPPVFRARNFEIQKGIVEARGLKEDADKRAAQVEAKIASLGAEVDRLRTESKVEMQQEGQRIRLETAAHIARLESQARGEIETAGNTAQRELKSYAAKLAIELAEQRLRHQLDGNADAKLVDGFVKDLGRMGSSN